MEQIVDLISEQAEIVQDKEQIAELPVELLNRVGGGTVVILI